MKRTVFLDRDGVVNRDSSNYIKSRDEFEFLPGSCEAFKMFTDSGFNVVIVTNQSAVGRGLMPLEELENIFAMMRESVLECGGDILDIFYCPHTPDEKCTCRKPEPGMLLAARDKLNLPLATSIMIGDSTKDIICAKRAGCGTSILVKTGNGEKAEKELKALGAAPDLICADLSEAAVVLADQADGPDAAGFDR